MEKAYEKKKKVAEMEMLRQTNSNTMLDLDRILNEVFRKIYELCLSQIS